MAEPELDSKPKGSSDGSGARSKRSVAELIGGSFLIVIVLVLLAILLVYRADSFSRPHWVSLYAGIAVVTGLAFWIYAPGSTGEVTVKELGIKLGGGAAVGAAFMLLAWWLTPLTEVLIVDVPDSVKGIASRFAIENSSPGLRAELLDGNNRILVEFSENRAEGRIHLVYFTKDLERQSDCFSAKRGKRHLTPCASEEKKP